MGIKIKNQIPKATDFSINDIIVNVKEGNVFYKDNDNNVYKIQGDNLSTPYISEFTIDNSIKGNLTISGSIVPEGSGSFDLGSAEFPWKDLHVLDESIKFYKKGGGEIGKVQFEEGKGLKVRDKFGAETVLSASIVNAIDHIRSPQGRFSGITGPCCNLKYNIDTGRLVEVQSDDF